MSTLQNILLFAGGITLFAAARIMVHIDLRDARNGHINHSRSLKWKILSSVLPGLLLSRALWNDNPLWLVILLGTLLTGVWFAFLFNGIWGVIIANDLFYRSTAVGKNLSRFDRFVLHWPKLLYAGVCIGIVSLVTLAYILHL